VDGPARLGPGVVLGPHAAVLGHAVLGPGCRVHAAAVVGDLPQDRAYAGGVTYCRLGAGTVVREHATVHRGTAEGSATVLGENCQILAGAHVAHNCLLGDAVQVVNGALLGGHVEVGRRAIVSGNAAVHQFVRIGELALIGGLAKVTQDVPPFLMFDGPGRCVGVNVVGMRRAGCTEEVREEIKAAYRLLYRSGLPWRAAVEASAALALTDAGRTLAAFLQTPSRRGIAARAREHR
jgi:UDP-N-acetylglucosamine acyltransferase